MLCQTCFYCMIVEEGATTGIMLRNREQIILLFLYKSTCYLKIYVFFRTLEKIIINMGASFCMYLKILEANII